MKYEVKTRNAKGGFDCLRIEAESRSALFAILKERGVEAISVEEVKGGSAGHREAIKVAPGVIKGVVALVLIVLGSCAYLLFSRPAPVVAEIAERRPASPVQVPTPEPVALPDPKPEPVIEPPKIDPDARPTKVGETVNGYIKLPSGRLHRVRGVITNSVSATQFKGKYEIFDHHCENEIACLLTIQPGEGLVGTPRYNGRFTKEFVESLKTPIVINQDDSLEDQALKRNVMQAKQMLKEALDRGEDIEKIMLDTRKEYQDLARYKMELKGLINEFKKGEDVTDLDVEEYVQAANKMLEEKGIAPLNIGPITRQKIRMMQLQRLQEQQ